MMLWLWCCAFAAEKTLFYRRNKPKVMYFFLHTCFYSTCSLNRPLLYIYQNRILCNKTWRWYNNIVSFFSIFNFKGKGTSYGFIHLPAQLKWKMFENKPNLNTINILWLSFTLVCPLNHHTPSLDIPPITQTMHTQLFFLFLLTSLPRDTSSHRHAYTLHTAP